MADDSRQDRVRWRDPFLRQGWTHLPNSVFSIPNISTGAKLTLIALMSYDWDKGGCFPGQERLAADVSATTRSVRNWVHELQEAKVLTVERGGFGEPNTYIIERWNLP